MNEMPLREGERKVEQYIPRFGDDIQDTVSPMTGKIVRVDEENEEVYFVEHGKEKDLEDIGAKKPPTHKRYFYQVRKLVRKLEGDISKE